MSEMTIRADIVAAGVGLPPVWWGQPTEGAAQWMESPSWRDWTGWGVVLASDPQTAFGLAMRLDEWEEASGDDSAVAWACSLGVNHGGPRYKGLVRELLARTERVGLDHTIRRARGCKVEAGTLGEVRVESACDYGGLRNGGPGRNWWVRFQAGDDVFTAGTYEGDAPSEIEALRAIYAEVCGG